MKYLNSVLFLLLFFTILIVMHPVIVISAYLGQRAITMSVYLLCKLILLALKVAGVSITIKGEVPSTELHHQRPLIIISNHQGMFDIPLLICTFIAYHPRFIAKKELEKNIPSISATLRATKACLINRTDRRGATEVIERFAKDIDEDTSPLRSCVVFPEGTRARDGELLPFKFTGITVLTEKVRAATVVPVVIDGSWKIVEHNLWPMKRGTTLSLTILPSIPAQEIAANPLLVETTIKEALHNVRAHAAS